MNTRICDNVITLTSNSQYWAHVAAYESWYQLLTTKRSTAFTCDNILYLAELSNMQNITAKVPPFTQKLSLQKLVF